MKESRQRTDPAWLAQRLEESYTELWRTVALLEPEEYEMPCLHTGWSPKMMLAHIAYWDDYQLKRMQAALTDAWAEEMPSHPFDNDERALHDNERSWTEVVKSVHDARQALIDFARHCTPSQIQANYRERGEERPVLYQLLHHMSNHVTEHSAEILRYCGSLKRWGRAGLRQFIWKQHENLLDSLGGLHEQTVTTVPIAGRWTVRDILAHVLAWEEYTLTCMRLWPSSEENQTEQWTADSSIDEINARLYAEKSHIDMIELLDSLATVNRRILNRYDQLPEQLFTQEGSYAWGEKGQLDELLFRMARHKAEHAAEIWEARLERQLSIHLT